jgi:repressor LexA
MPRGYPLAGERPLTARQRELLLFVRRYSDEHGYPPTMREIGRAMGITSAAGVADHLRLLALKGWIERVPLASRAIRILRPLESA